MRSRNLRYAQASFGAAWASEWAVTVALGVVASVRAAPLNWASSRSCACCPRRWSRRSAPHWPFHGAAAQAERVMEAWMQGNP